MLDNLRNLLLGEKQVLKKSVKLIPLADFHTGGTTALFPYFDGADLGYPPHPKMTGQNGGWKFKHQIYPPTGKQYRMFRHFTKCAEQIAASIDRETQRIIVVEAGDSVDGVHHDTPQLATRNVGEQNQVHIWLMKYFMHKIGFDKNKGDLLYIGAGTETHTGDEEDNIAVELGAELLPDGSDTFDFMSMDINGARFWFLHQGASAGRGLSTGNALHNWMKNAYFSCLEDKRVIPDCVISGHYHRNVYDIFSRNDRKMHGIILPPFQLKTRFGHRVAAAEMNDVGIRPIDISADGEVTVNKSILMQDYEEVVVV